MCGKKGGLKLSITRAMVNKILHTALIVHFIRWTPMPLLGVALLLIQPMSVMTKIIRILQIQSIDTLSFKKIATYGIDRVGCSVNSTDRSLWGTCTCRNFVCRIGVISHFVRKHCYYHSLRRGGGGIFPSSRSPWSVLNHVINNTKNTCANKNYCRNNWRLFPICIMGLSTAEERSSLGCNFRAVVQWVQLLHTHHHRWIRC